MVEFVLTSKPPKATVFLSRDRGDDIQLCVTPCEKRFPDADGSKAKLWFRKPGFAAEARQVILHPGPLRVGVTLVSGEPDSYNAPRQGR